MTYTLSATAGPAGRSYDTPYDLRDGDRPAGFGRAIGAFVILSVVLVVVLVTIKPLVALGLALAGAAVIGLRTARRRGLLPAVFGR